MIRQAVAADAQAIAAIWNPVIRDTTATFTTVEKSEAGLIETIATRQGEWVSRKALWREVWTDYPNLPPQDTVINTAVSRLRRVLSAVGGAPGLLSEDLGYRLVPGSQA